MFRRRSWYDHMSLHFLTDPGWIWRKCHYAEPCGGQALPERRAPWAHPVLPVPGGGGDLHVAGLSSGEANQAAKGVSAYSFPESKVWLVIIVHWCQPGALVSSPLCGWYGDFLAFSSSFFLPPFHILTASIHVEDAISAGTKWYLNKWKMQSKLSKQGL